ncbi:MAG: c-type cytochrome biogenesis protein CcsB [Candidatus Xenobiia bacterium LiM19]
MSFGLYFLSFVLFFVYAVTRKESLGRTATILLGIGLLANTVNLVSRGLAAGRVPFSNLYESLVIFMWGITVCLIWFMARWRLYLIGTVTLPLVLAMAFYATTVRQDVESLMPALKSDWIVYHVATAIIAYGAFAVSFSLAILYLARDFLECKKSGGRFLEMIPDLAKLDAQIYRVIAFGFPFLVLLIITGAIWAEQAWGQYWSWDPKETWSLITMLIYAGFLHARYFLKWRGRLSALFAIIGFISVVFCYIGVNLFLPGLHSYGSK